MRVETFTLGPLATNAYLLTLPDTKRAVLIDPGKPDEALLDRVAELEVEAILLTHAHFDHIGGVEAFREATGAPVYLHGLEQEWLGDAELNGSARWQDITAPVSGKPADKLVEDGQTLALLETTFNVLHTPGHSPGSVSYHCGQLLFGGDVLFKHSVGRTDLPGGSPQALYDAIHGKLFILPPETEVYPGHGPATIIGDEMRNNPYV